MANSVYADQKAALSSLQENKFKFYSQYKVRLPDLGSADQKTYLNDYAAIAAFLCDDASFTTNLNLVSVDLWNHYRALPHYVRNKFSRALGKAAVGANFNFSNNYNNYDKHGAPMAVMLIAGDPQLGWMLREKLFWKDSMNLRHGEFSHAVQWLTIAKWAGTTTPVADLYSYTGCFRANAIDPSKGGEKQQPSMWQWLADCFPSDMKKAANATVFTNKETLESQSFRSPQAISDYLLMGNRAGPLPGNFLSNYLYWRYKNRNWLKEEYLKFNDEWKNGVVSIDESDPRTHRQDTRSDRGWNHSTNTNKAVSDARLARAPARYQGVWTLEQKIHAT